jgi:hypothetical protein
MKNNLYKAALMAALGLAGAMTARAQYANDDLILGFTSNYGGNTTDYLVDLGQIPTGGNITANEETSLNVSGFSWSTFNTYFGSALANNAVNLGIVGAHAGSTGNVIFSEYNNGSGATVLSPGSSTPPADTRSALQNGAAIPESLTLGPVAQGGNSFYNLVAENPNTDGAAANSFAGYVDNPLSTLGSGETIVFDLYEDSYSLAGAGSWAYDGNVTVSLNGEALSAVYDVPEPATYALFGSMGVLLLGMRRRRSSRIA